MCNAIMLQCFVGVLHARTFPEWSISFHSANLCVRHSLLTTFLVHFCRRVNFNICSFPITFVFCMVPHRYFMNLRSELRSHELAKRLSHRGFFLHQRQSFHFLTVTNAQKFRETTTKTDCLSMFSPAGTALESTASLIIYVLKIDWHEWCSLSSEDLCRAHCVDPKHPNVGFCVRAREQSGGDGETKK